MADNSGGGNSFLGVIVGALLVVVLGLGAFMYMDPGIQMQTIFGDGSQQSQNSGFLGALMGAGKRLLTGESLFMTVFQNQGVGSERRRHSASCAWALSPRASAVLASPSASSAR